MAARAGSRADQDDILVGLMKPRFLAAMLSYGALAVLAAATLSGLFRIAVWIFLAGLALKTWIAAVRKD